MNYSYRVRAEVLCNIQLQRSQLINYYCDKCYSQDMIYKLSRQNLFDRFPHDTQHCHINLESWTFTEEDMRFVISKIFGVFKLKLLRLTWESPSSAAFGMSHFKMVNYHFDPVSAHYEFA